jgi:hypothetical protein
MKSPNYNGWANYETWNVALWLQNDESLYNLCQDSDNYSGVLDILSELGLTHTKDGVSYSSPLVEVGDLDRALFGAE